MTQRLVGGWMVVSLVCAAAAGTGRAAEWSARTTKPPATTAPATTHEHPVLSLEGTVTARDPYGQPQQLLVTAADGNVVTLMIDPTQASITNAETPSSFEELKEGDQVTVRYVEQDGQLWLTSLAVVPLPPTAAPSPEPTADAGPPVANTPDESTP